MRTAAAAIWPYFLNRFRRLATAAATVELRGFGPQIIFVRRDDLCFQLVAG